MLKENDYVVIRYQHVDDHRCFRPLEESLPDQGKRSVQKLKKELEEMFEKAGWEGDGIIKCVFLPPCFFSKSGDNYCEIIYHVKQSNNGTSFFIVPKRLEHTLSFPKDMFS